METSNEAKALADIVQWSEECCAWQRDALRQLYSGSLTETDIDELAVICTGISLIGLPRDTNVY